MTGRVLAAIALVLTLGVLAAGMAITASEGDNLPWWFVLTLALASVGLGYGTTSGRRRQAVLLTASGGLMVMGVLGLLTIGLPLLVAAVLGIVSALLPTFRSGATAP